MGLQRCFCSDGVINKQQQPRSAPLCLRTSVNLVQAAPLCFHGSVSRMIQQASTPPPPPPFWGLGWYNHSRNTELAPLEPIKHTVWVLAHKKPSLAGTLLKTVETTTGNRLYHDFHGFLDGCRGSTSSVTVRFTRSHTGLFSCTKEETKTGMHL